jgi:predicted Kef-type K+ transport protein
LGASAIFLSSIAFGFAAAFLVRLIATTWLRRGTVACAASGPLVGYLLLGIFAGCVAPDPRPDGCYGWEIGLVGLAPSLLAWAFGIAAGYYFWQKPSDAAVPR